MEKMGGAERQTCYRVLSTDPVAKGATCYMQPVHKELIK